MSAFTSSLNVQLSPVSDDGKRITLLEPLVWEQGAKGSGRRIVVPAGFRSDGITSPRVSWPWIPPVGHPASRAAVLHDYLIERYRREPEGPHAFAETRKAIDAEFFEACVACGVNARWAGIMWCGVRLWALLKGDI